MEYRIQRIGLTRCPKQHTALGHPFYNAVNLKDDEGIGSEIYLKCGLCQKKFKGKVEKIDERFIEERSR